MKEKCKKSAIINNNGCGKGVDPVRHAVRERERERKKEKDTNYETVTLAFNDHHCQDIVNG